MQLLFYFKFKEYVKKAIKEKFGHSIYKNGQKKYDSCLGSCKQNIL